MAAEFVLVVMGPRWLELLKERKASGERNFGSELKDAKEKVESWRVDYNEQRPHRELGDLPQRFRFIWPDEADRFFSLKTVQKHRAGHTGYLRDNFCQFSSLCSRKPLTRRGLSEFAKNNNDSLTMIVL